MAKSFQSIVDKYVESIEPELAKLVIAIRKSILGINAEISEEIKWNSPSFFYSGEMKAFDAKEYKRDIVVLNLRKGFPLLIFPTGSIIEDSSGFLEGNFKDTRKMASIRSLEELTSKEKNLHAVIIKWLSLIER
jgi:hypothetical protein